jgi:diguanylate cyclase (GGDEF)-like protein
MNTGAVLAFDIGADLPDSKTGRNRVLLRGGTGLAVVIIAAFLLLGTQLYRLPFGVDTNTAIAAVVFALFAMLAPIACALASRVAPHHERTGWILLAAGSALMAAGDSLALSLDGSDALGTALSAPIASMLWLSSYVAFFIAALGFLDPVPAIALRRLRRAVDIVLIVLLTAALVFSIALFPTFGMRPQRELVSSLPSYVSLVLSISLLAVVLTSKPRLRLWHVPLFVATLAIIAGSLVATLIPWTEPSLVDAALTRVMDLPWLIAYGMFTFAAIVRIRQRDVALHLQKMQVKPTPVRSTILVMSATLLALPAFVYLGLSWQGDSLGTWLFIVLAALLGIATIARNVVLSLENDSLREYALVDPLTRLYNHRFFQEQLTMEIQRAQREDRELSLVCLDVDDFDQTNNIYGHAAGDRRLAAIASGLVASARSSDLACRVGGDEFAIIMPDTSPVEAFKVCLRLQDEVRTIDPECPLPIGLSIGIAAAPEHGDTREDLTHKADGALYWAKLHGREQVTVYDPELVVSLGPEQRIQLLEEESYVRMVQLLASAVDARDPYTQQHSRRVAMLAVAFAEAIRLDPERIGQLETAALLHDVGKIGVADAILRKDGRLTNEEYSQITEHPQLAVRILSAIPKRDVLLPWISSHHERWDGTGYPNGLRAQDIPLEARILALCDAYDAMTSARPYRTAMLPENALLELEMGAGTQFDAQLTASFVGHMHRRLSEQHGAPEPSKPAASDLDLESQEDQGKAYKAIHHEHVEASRQPKHVESSSSGRVSGTWPPT